MNFSAKKLIFENCHIKRARKCNFEKNRFFGRKIHSKNLKNDQIEVVGPKCLNALYNSDYVNVKTPLTNYEFSRSRKEKANSRQIY